MLAGLGCGEAEPSASSEAREGRPEAPEGQTALGSLAVSAAEAPAVTTAAAGPEPLAVTTATAEPEPAAATDDQATLDDHQRARIQEWLDAVAEPRPDEPFGTLLVRAARHRLGVPYAGVATTVDPEERLRVDVDALDCVTLIETADAVARCAWRRTPDVGCFMGELRQTRYRDGRIDGYASRLHYFEDWLADNERRHRLRSLADELGAVEVTRSFDFMTKHPRRYPALRDDPAAREAVRAVELRLSETPWHVVPRDRIGQVQHLLRDGDVLAFVESTPGLGVGHTGLVSMGDDGKPRVLHATNLGDGKVTETRCDLATCMRRRPDRTAVIVMRPLAPVDGDPVAVAVAQ